MTPEAAAKHVVKCLLEDEAGTMENIIACAIRAAVAEEREACAKLACDRAARSRQDEALCRRVGDVELANDCEIHATVADDIVAAIRRRGS